MLLELLIGAKNGSLYTGYSMYRYGYDIRQDRILQAVQCSTGKYSIVLEQAGSSGAQVCCMAVLVQDCF